ncbi:MAG TPA: hypothetical protein VMC83_19600 [Streptosporangiaceae bacterium]|nr:hypothetical protein [Streptosporangiaceae bacterium]
MNQTGGDVGQAGGELERRPENVPEQGPQNLPVPYRRGEIASVIDWPELATWARNRGVVVFAIILIAAQLIWKSFFISNYFFWQDDFHFLELGLGHSFDWSYLTYVGAGHLFPGVYAIAWVVARIALYNWGFASAITVIMLAASDLAALRLLRTLFGDRPAIVTLLLIYLLSPLTMLDLRWWSTAIELLPMQIALFMALNAQVHYVRTGRFRHAIAVAAWLVFGLVFFEKALVLPLLLLGVTSAFLMEGPWPATILQCLVRYWKSWLLQVAILAVYAVVFTESLHTSTAQPTMSGVGQVVSFTWELVKNNFVPGALGGPWQWLTTADAQYAASAPPGGLTWLALIVAAAVILASIALRRYAWRAWAILAGWLVAADVTPVILGRVEVLSASVLALQTRYVSDALGVLIVCMGLAFLPPVGQPDIRKRPAIPAGTQAGRMAAAGLVGAFVIGSVWSVQDLQSTTSGLQTRLYLYNAQAAVSDAPAGTVIEESQVPGSIMIGAFGVYADTSKVISPMENAADKGRIRWTSSPHGTIDHLLMFGTDGRLHETAIYGQDSAPPATGRACHPISHGRVVASFPAPSYPSGQVLRIAYLADTAASGADMTVRYGNSTQQLVIEPGLHSGYLAVRGSVRSVTITSPAIRGLCIGDVRAGLIVPSPTGLVIPAAY